MGDRRSNSGVKLVERPGGYGRQGSTVPPMLYPHSRYHKLMQATNSRLSRTFSSLAIRNYRLFWLGQLVSLSGTWMQTTAQAWLVLKLTNSPEALGTVTVLQFLPVTLLTLFGGVLADRLPKRTVIICTQTVAALQAFVLAFLVLTN